MTVTEAFFCVFRDFIVHELIPTLPNRWPIPAESPFLRSAQTIIHSRTLDKHCTTIDTSASTPNPLLHYNELNVFRLNIQRVWRPE
jgi:hypothetical protein